MLQSADKLPYKFLWELLFKSVYDIDIDIAYILGYFANPFPNFREVSKSALTLFFVFPLPPYLSLSSLQLLPSSPPSFLLCPCLFPFYGRGGEGEGALKPTQRIRA